MSYFENSLFTSETSCLFFSTQAAWREYHTTMSGCYPAVSKWMKKYLWEILFSSRKHSHPVFQFKPLYLLQLKKSRHKILSQCGNDKRILCSRFFKLRETMMNPAPGCSWPPICSSCSAKEIFIRSCVTSLFIFLAGCLVLLFEGIRRQFKWDHTSLKWDHFITDPKRLAVDPHRISCPVSQSSPR